MKHVDIPENERENLSFLMVSVYSAIREASHATGINGRRLRSLIATRGLDRDKWLDLSFTDYAAVKKAGPAVLAIFRVQDRLIEGYQRLISRVVRQIRHSIDLNLDDATQEANLALIDSIFGYDGSQAFLPFAAGNIRRRLTRMGVNGGVARLGRRATKVRRQVRAIHVETRKPYHQILDEMGITEPTRETVLSSLRKVVRELACDADRNDFFKGIPSKTVDPAEEVCNEDERQFNVSLVTIALEEAGLNEYEQSLIELGMQEEKGWQSRLADVRGVSRSAVSAAYLKALDKVRVCIERMVAA
jgi:RNA polymerase sigma factor (sigma-70 family)